MARHFCELESSTGAFHKGEEIGYWEDFDITDPSQSNFVTTKTLNASSRIKVYHNGLLQREGSNFDYTKNIASSRIEFLVPRLKDSWVRIEWF